MCEKPVLTSSHWIKLSTATKVDVIAKRQCLVENSIVDGLKSMMM